MLLNLTIPGYKIISLLHEGLNTVIYRALSQPKRSQVVLKVSKAEYPSREQIIRLKHEYSIGQNLDLEGVVKVLKLETYQNRLVLVMEDFGGISLKEYIASEKLSLVTFLSIALQIAQTLVIIHGEKIIHKDIKPSNLVINTETGVSILCYPIIYQGDLNRIRCKMSANGKRVTVEELVEILKQRQANQ